MAEHAYSVIPFVDNTTVAGTMHYRAECTCERSFPTRDAREEAGLDGLDHVRTTTGRPTRRQEIADEKAEAASRRGTVSPMRRT